MKTEWIIAPGYEGELRAAGLGSFERLWSVEAPASAVTRAVPGRFTVRVEVPAGGAGPASGAGPAGGAGTAGLVLYLKRYRGALRAAAAAREWRALQEVAAAGIPCPAPVAFGERRGIFARESLLATLEIPGAVQADRWIRDRPSRKAVLVEAVAHLARKLHDAGFHHQDLYLCHFFIRERSGEEGPAAGGLECFLIDLQRCGRLGLRRLRWIVKDLAQVHFSMGQAGLGREEWREFLRLYGPPADRLEPAILRKSARIARHVPKYG